jgi:hypothetical protein
LLSGTYQNTHIHDVMRTALESGHVVYLPLIRRSP